MSLPLLISVPHAGTEIPPEIAGINLLSIEQIIKDGDEGAGIIYDLQDDVREFVTTEIARAYVDLNRPETDRGSDGVVKTETIYKESIYDRELQESQVKRLLTNYYYPYHKRLSQLCANVMLGIDCHTMAAEAPPISLEPGRPRPHICLSDGDGTCPKEWTLILARCLEKEFDFDISVNEPFKGGHIIRSHAHELPWLQLELSRADFLTLEEKKCRVLAAFTDFCRELARRGKGND